ncbi:MAG: recombination mediator RecR [Oscillospiraceae bacterium]|jgi:recombination protein RecR|nr:recombination mediator RecR [Oscillospiraceae bacterium]
MKLPETGLPTALSRLADSFAALPGVGSKSARRMAFHILNFSDERAAEFADAILSVKRDIRACRVCGNLSDDELCAICSSDRRDVSKICVVETAADLLSIERTREYDGLYHVLGGVISPIRRITPDSLNIKTLLRRISDGGNGESAPITEVIMATNPGAEGEATAMYLSRLIRPFGVRVTRLAYGIPVGGNVEFSDNATLYRALEGRVDV